MLIRVVEGAPPSIGDANVSFPPKAATSQKDAALVAGTTLCANVWIGWEAAICFRRSQSARRSSDMPIVTTRPVSCQS